MNQFDKLDLTDHSKPVGTSNSASPGHGATPAADAVTVSDAARATVDHGGAEQSSLVGVGNRMWHLLFNLTKDSRSAAQIALLSEWDRVATPAPAREAGLVALVERARPDDIRALGWSVAVHNDYRLNGEAHTFWLFTKGDRAVKGEGKTDVEALDHVRTGIAALVAQGAREAPEEC